MKDHRAALVTDADVRSLAAKLTGLHARLMPVEQVLLHEVLRRSGGSGRGTSDLGGLAWTTSFNPFPSLDAVAQERPRGEEEHGR